MTDKEIPAAILKKGGKKKREGGISSNKSKSVEEHQRIDEAHMTTATGQSILLESMIWVMKAEERALPTFSIPAKVKPITVQVQEGTAHCNCWIKILDSIESLGTRSEVDEVRKE